MSGAQRRIRRGSTPRGKPCADPWSWCKRAMQPRQAKEIRWAQRLCLSGPILPCFSGLPLLVASVAFCAWRAAVGAVGVVGVVGRPVCDVEPLSSGMTDLDSDHAALIWGLDASKCHLQCIQWWLSSSRPSALFLPHFNSCSAALDPIAAVPPANASLPVPAPWSGSSCDSSSPPLINPPDHRVPASAQGSNFVISFAHRPVPIFYSCIVLRSPVHFATSPSFWCVFRRLLVLSSLPLISLRDASHTCILTSLPSTHAHRLSRFIHPVTPRYLPASALCLHQSLARSCPWSIDDYRIETSRVTVIIPL